MTSQDSPTYSTVDLTVESGTAEVQVCLTCGALVGWWTDTHDEWHAGLARRQWHDTTDSDSS